MRLRVAEIYQNAVAHVPGDEAVEPGDNFGDSAVIRGDHVTQILGIEACRQRGRADQIAEHHGQLPAFGVGGRRGIGRCYHRSGGGCDAERNNCGQQLSPVADRGHADTD
jgi:hypothetical protein